MITVDWQRVRDFIGEHIWPLVFFVIAVTTWRELVLIRHDFDILGLGIYDALQALRGHV